MAECEETGGGHERHEAASPGLLASRTHAHAHAQRVEPKPVHLT